MHDPERASAAESREFQSRCRMPLGDIACHVHAAEKERRSAFSWTLQCRQAVAGLFETHQKILAKPVDVMEQAPRGPSEPTIRHQKSPGRIVRSEERRVGTERVRTLRYRGGPY